MKLKQYILTTGMLVAAALPMQAQAATSTATLNVTATAFAPAANITTGLALDFGSFLVSAAAASSSASSFDVTVTNGVPYTIGLTSAHLAPISGFQFGMLDTVSGAVISYSLWKDSALTVIMDSTTFGAAYPNETGTGAAINYPVYAGTTWLGQIPGQGPLIAGTYTDTVTITVTY